MTVLCDFDRSLIEQAYALASARIPQPVAPDKCDLCAELGRHCLAHKTPNDFATPRNPA